MDREVDHGEESESEEEIDENEKEGGSGAQEEEKRKICREETGETYGEKGGSKAQGSGQEACSRNAGG